MFFFSTQPLIQNKPLQWSTDSNRVGRWLRRRFMQQQQNIDIVDANITAARQEQMKV